MDIVLMKKGLRITAVAIAVIAGMLAAYLVAPGHVFASAQEQKAEGDPEIYECKSEVGERVTPDMIPGEKKSGLSLDYVPTKYIPTIAIVIGLDNIGYDNSYDWSEVMFGNTDSVSEYFLDMSFQKMSFKPVNEASYYGRDGNTNKADEWNDGVIHVNVNRDHRNWGLKDQKDPAELVRVLNDGLTNASSYINFTQFDENDNDDIEPYELTIVFIIAGYDYSVGNKTFDDSMYLRSHRYTFTGAIQEYNVTDVTKPRFTANGKTVKINPYVCVSEKREVYDSKTGKTTIMRSIYGTIAHELGHQLGLPDLYDTVVSSKEKPWEEYAVYYTSLMSHGGHCVDENGNSRPTSLDPWSRIYLGWMEPEKITASGTYTATAEDYSDTEKGMKVFRIDMPYEGEYYLIENRYTEKWDSGLIKQHYSSNHTKDDKGGLIVWHISDSVFNECSTGTWVRYMELNNPEHRPAVMPLFPEKDADGHYTTIGSEGPVISKPLFDKYIMENQYSDIGPYINLPTYGSFDITDRPEDREDSNKYIKILSDAGKSMSFEYSLDHTHRWVRSYESVPEDICTNGGFYNLVRTCRDCGKQDVRTIYHPAGKHFRVRHIYGIEPTCESDGRQDHYWCITCGKKFYDEDMTRPINESDIKIEGGHKWDEGKVIQEPTYNADGIREYTCKVCAAAKWENIPTLDHTKKKAPDGTSCGAEAAIQVADKAIRKSTSEKDMPGSEFRRIQLSSAKQGKKSIKLSWIPAVDYYDYEADYYYVYGAKCGKNKFVKLKKLRGTSFTVKKIGKKSLRKGTYYKFIVVAVYGSSEEVLSTSKTVHVATKGSKARSNYTGISVSSKAVKKAAQMREGQTVSLNAKARKKSGTKVTSHVKLRYESGDKSVATVSSKGVIKAKYYGECNIYVYTQNGKYKRIHVAVD